MTTESLIDYYVDLLIVQYANQPNARATIAAFVREVIQDQIAQQVENGFGFNVGVGFQPGTAQGVQLDAVASYRGVTRQVYGLVLNRSYFTMPIYGQADADTVPGFAVYGESPINWFFFTYEDASQPIYALNDDEMLRLTQFRAQTQSMLLSIENIDNVLFEFFSDNVAVFDTGNMQITYIDLISDTDTLFTIAAATKSLPRPAGVRVNVIRSETLNEFFGFQIYGQAFDTDFVGFGLYGSPQTGSFVRYP